MKAIGSYIAQGLAWWGRELVELLPPSVRPSRRDDAKCALVRLLASTTQVEVFEGADVTVYEFSAWPNLAPPEIEHLKELIGRHEISLCLSDEETYSVELRLPLEARRHLRQAVHYQLMTLAPLEPSRLLFDMQVSRGETDALLVNCMMVRADRIDDISAWWTSIGFLPPSIGWAGPNATRLEYVFQQVRGLDPQGLQVRQRRLAVSLCCMLVGAPLLVWAGAATGEAFLRQHIDRQKLMLRPQIAAAAETARLTRTEAQLSNLMQQPRAAAIIEALAQTLPANSWIERMQFNGQEVVLQGHGEDGSAVVLSLHQSPLLHGARLHSTHTDPGGSSQFEIRLPLAPTLKETNR